jgi:hypothetical protein
MIADDDDESSTSKEGLNVRKAVPNTADFGAPFFNRLNTEPVDYKVCFEGI